MATSLSIHRALLISTVGPLASIIIVVWRWIYLHEGEEDFGLMLANYAVAWLPFAISILIAFVPDMRKAHIAWRVLVIFAGLTYSIVLFKQQILSMAAAKRDQERATRVAIEESNKHSDQKIGEVRQDVRGVKSDVQGVKKDLQDTVKKSTSSLSESIGKVGKPEPPQLAQLRFTLWTDTTSSEQFPLVTKTQLKTHEGSVTMEFTIQNIADVPAEDVELWIKICRDCRFAKEPEGFNHFKGQLEQDRHKGPVPRILSGIAIEKMTAEIIPPPVDNRFEVDLFYGCKNCVVVTRPGPNKEVFLIDVVRTN